MRQTRTWSLMLVPLLLIGLASVCTAGERVVAIGDIHGSFDGLVDILTETGLIDADLHWTGGETTLIQVGDLFDRGVNVRQVLDLLMRLQDEASVAGGKVEVLLGNHETMNLVGFYRDANPEAYAEFAGPNSEKERKKGFRAFGRFWTARARAAGVEPPKLTSKIKEQWMAEHPLGWMEYQEALAPEGKYGAWLRERPILERVGDILYVHGGLGPALAGMSIAEINQKVAEELATYDRIRAYMIDRYLVPSTAGLATMNTAYQQLLDPDSKLNPLADSDAWFLTSPDGPVWFRGAAKWDDYVRGEEMAGLLAGVGAKRMVVGHTPQYPRQIQVRFGGTVFLIDTGMLSSHYEGGRPSALVIDEGTFTAVYPGESEELDVEEQLPAVA